MRPKSPLFSRNSINMPKKAIKLIVPCVKYNYYQFMGDVGK